ncbi:MAG: MotA/TolQ/ExbB proton channel family protein [Steroidobacteraceae bacterium]
MKNSGRAEDFWFELFALIIIIIVVQTTYATVVRPRAEEIRAADIARMKSDPLFVPVLSPWVVISEPEPETCVIFAFWAFTIIGRKAIMLSRNRKLLQTDVLHLAEGMKILPEDTREYARQVEALPAEARWQLLPRALTAALHRFAATRNIQDVSDAARAVCETESDRLDSELAMVRFVAWSIPAIGFVGTVRGIGASLQQAHRAVEGDVSGVVAGLGVSFNSTLVALSLSILVMFMLHQIQLRQERLVLDIEEYLDERVVRHMVVR